MDEKLWWQSKTIWSALVAAVCGIVAITGHTVDPAAQSQIVGAITDIANGVGVLAGVAAAYYRSKSTTSVAPIVPPKK